MKEATSASTRNRGRRAGKQSPPSADPPQSPYLQFAARRGQAAPWLRKQPSADAAIESRRALDRAREMTPERRLYKKRRHQERMATDPDYRELKRLKARRKYARRKAARVSAGGPS
jgi:hypothetical protein